MTTASQDHPSGPLDRAGWARSAKLGGLSAVRARTAASARHQGQSAASGGPFCGVRPPSCCPECPGHPRTAIGALGQRQDRADMRQQPHGFMAAAGGATPAGARAALADLGGTAETMHGELLWQRIDERKLHRRPSRAHRQLRLASSSPAPDGGSHHSRVSPATTSLVRSDPAHGRPVPAATESLDQR